MKKIPLALAIWATLLSGCGTVCNLASENPAVPFGGLQADFACLNTSSSSSDKDGKAGFIFLFCVELPLSALGDIVTLPLAVYLHHTDGYDSVDHHGDDDSPSSAAPQEKGPPVEAP